MFHKVDISITYSTLTGVFRNYYRKLELLKAGMSVLCYKRKCETFLCLS